MGEWVLHFDGLYEPRYTQRGIATYGFVAAHDGEVVHEGKGLVAPPGPVASANVAEFGAMIQALAWLREHREAGETIVVRGDSRLAIETVAGRWNLTSERLIPLRDAAIAIAREVGVARFEKVSREENAEADRLSREAYHELTALHAEWGLGIHSRSRRRPATPQRS